jgi:hypothetical protein
MQGRKDVESDKLVGDLRTFVEESELSIPKIAGLMGIFGATLTMWIA